MAVRKLYVKPETRHLSVRGENLMEQEIVPVVSDGETEVNNGLFDDDEDRDDGMIPVGISVWN